MAARAQTRLVRQSLFQVPSGPCPAAPTTSDLDPVAGEYALGVLAALKAESAAGFLDISLVDGNWVVHMPTSEIPEGITFPLQRWALECYPTIRHEYLAQERKEEEATNG